VRQQVEATAKRRLKEASDNDVIMKDVDSAPDIDELAIGDTWTKAHKQQAPPRVTFNDAEVSSPHRPSKTEDKPVSRPSDPDPFVSFGLDKVRSRSRRGSLAPISPEEISTDGRKKSVSPRSSPRSSRTGTPSPSEQKVGQFFSDPFAASRRPKPRQRASKGANRGALPDKVLVTIFKNMELHDLIRLRAVSLHWQQLLTKSPELFHYLDLSVYNRVINDQVLSKSICPFVGARPRTIDISNCFHITDEGFASLAFTCGTNVLSWRMKSVWDVTAPAILEMANAAKGLQDVDLSNCRKVSDTLLARIVGWVVPHSPAHHHARDRPTLNTRVSSGLNTNQPPPGTVFGCPELKSITLSYCKHVTDRSMHHIASHAASRIEYVDLTRCTTITDTGFQYWGNAQFSRLRKLCLADCTYLTDNAIIYLTNAAKGLQELDLVSYCALILILSC
jgi:F-box/leucine-rich repeat protein 7